MSWELLLIDVLGHAPPAEARLPDHLEVMGDRARVRADIDAALEGVVWSDTDGVLVDGGHAVQFFLGEDGSVTQVRVVVTGPVPRSARHLVVHLCLVSGWAALDVAARAFLDLDDDGTGS